MRGDGDKLIRDSLKFFTKLPRAFNNFHFVNKVRHIIWVCVNFLSLRFLPISNAAISAISGNDGNAAFN